MEPTAETSEKSTSSSSGVTDNSHDDPVSPLPNDGGMEIKHEIDAEEVQGILEVTATTGKFWHDWEKLKSMMSFQLKQVWGAIHSFVEGPPFTLQRLCEILLDARSMYPNLSKLALALEKNLLVTSTLTISTEPFPPTITGKTQNRTEKGTEGRQHDPDLVQNGAEPLTTDKDETTADMEDDDVALGMETFEDIVRSSETDSTPADNS